MGLYENDCCNFVASFLSHGQVKKNLSWLFREHGDVDQTAFLKSPLDKETMGHTTNSETSKFWRLLMKRTKQNHLCEVPACSARAWLARIWKDVPSARPNQDLLVSCVVRWLVDPYETQGRRFKRTPYMQRKSNAKDIKDLVP